MNTACLRPSPDDAILAFWIAGFSAAFIREWLDRYSPAYRTSK